VIQPRVRIVLITVGLLALLDAGRSAYARVGFASPYELWQPDPKEYADLAWPPNRVVPANAGPGRRTYIERCAVCHGPDGRGNGPAAPSLIPRPRDFTLGQYKYKSTPLGQPPTDEDLYRVVADGLHDSAMPYWNDILTAPQIRGVVAYVKSLSPTFAQAVAPLSVPARVAPDAASIDRGRLLYAAEGCVACHGTDGRLQLTSQDAKGYTVIARDLTAPWSFRRGSEPEEIWLRLTTGLAPGPMPSYAGSTTPAERWDLVNYVLSLSRVPPWEPSGAFGGRGTATDRAKRGEYLVRAEMCGLCHTQINRTGIYRDSMYLAGGMRVGAYPHGVFVSRNLTSDPETGLGRWSEAEIARAVRTGRTPSRMVSPWGMPWIFLHGLADEDALAIGAYLKRLPARRNAAPVPLRYGFVETVIAKTMSGPPASLPTFLTYTEGNFSRVSPGPDRTWPQTVLVWAQVIVLVGGTILFIFARRERVRPGRKRWTVVTAVVLGLIALVLWGLYATPTIPLIPAAQIAGPIEAQVPKVDTASLGSSERVRMATRGRYLFSVAGCAFCHTGTGSGGAKLSWVAFGTLWVRNITPDSATGIGTWTDAEIARAIRGGVSADGRMLHWQGMIWDHASNWDEEDTRAIVTYLRTLPPVRRAIPAPRPPSPDDCRVYTFFIADRTEPGCS
jgi:mono/diheme cytochrome c family protein